VTELSWREAEVDVFNFEVEGVHNYFVSARGGGDYPVLVHNPKCNLTGGGDSKGVGKGAKELPALDSTGKVHGELPRPKDLGDYEVEDLQQLRDELGQSVKERIRKNSELGPKGGHGERQAAEQDLIKSIDKHLEDR